MKEEILHGVSILGRLHANSSLKNIESHLDTLKRGYFFHYGRNSEGDYKVIGS